jgi:hypothetical protein
MVEKSNGYLFLECTPLYFIIYNFFDENYFTNKYYE